MARKSECTAQCGLGYRTLEIHCAKIIRADGKTQKVDDRYCSGQHKPDNKEGCHGDCNPGGWDYSPWSEVGAAASLLSPACGSFPHNQCRFLAPTVHQELRWGNPPSRGSVPEGSRGRRRREQVQPKGQTDRPVLQRIPLSSMEDGRLV